MGSLREWASEGEPKEVGETERTLRYQIKHMIVCDERMLNTSSRVAPQEFDSCPSRKQPVHSDILHVTLSQRQTLECSRRILF